MKTLFGCLLLCGLALCSSARAGSLEHVDRLAIEVRERANFVCWELYGTCRALPAYDQVYRDAKEVWSTAGHIRNLVLNSGNHAKIQRDVVEMDQLLTKIRMQIDTWCSHGHVHGNTFELKQKLAALDHAVKHLMQDVGAHPHQMPGPSAGPQMMPMNGAAMMPNQMMTSHVGSFFPGSSMPQPQLMGPSGYPQVMGAGVPSGYNPPMMNAGVPAGYNPQASMPNYSGPSFPGLNQFGR